MFVIHDSRRCPDERAQASPDDGLVQSDCADPNGYSSRDIDMFGEFADRREAMAMANAIAAQPFDGSFDYSQNAAQDDFWFDFMADTGDGWSSTSPWHSSLPSRPGLLPVMIFRAAGCSSWVATRSIRRHRWRIIGIAFCILSRVTIRSNRCWPREDARPLRRARQSRLV